MRKQILSLGFGLSLLAAAPATAQFSYFSSYDANGVPSNIMSPLETIDSAFNARINASFPESYAVPTYHPEYLTATAPTDLHLHDSCDVWITFVNEGAGYQNSLGFYTYNTNNVPTTPPPASSIKMIFPNVSLPGYGGALWKGSKVYLGRYPNNTGIGWVCVSDGWTGSGVGNGNYVLYSNPAMNPEADPALRRHIAQVYDPITQKIILGFEDIRRDYAGCDQDFNDIMFYVTANPITATNYQNMPSSTTPGGQAGTGNGGGLESESLGDLVSKRDFNRIRHDIDYKVDYSKCAVFSNRPALARAKTTAQLLTNLVPAQLETGDIPRVTSPSDLTSLTIAKEVISVDYTRNSKAKAVVLGITTLDKAYNHTKSICDRFRGAQLMRVDSIRVKGYNCVRFALKQENGEMEYAIAFAAGASKTRSDYRLYTNWLISDYGADDTVYNFQVWATMPHYAIKLAGDILDNLAARRSITHANAAVFTLPKAYITVGNRVKGDLKLQLNNTTNITNAKLVFEERMNEQSNAGTREVAVTLAPGANNTISVPIQDGYEYEGRLYLNNELVDEVYLADGNWGLDYDHSLTSIDQYRTNNSPNREYRDDEYTVYRNVTLKATTSDYISLYKSIKPGYGIADLSTYNSLKFSAKGTGKVEVHLIRDGITQWKDQYATTLELNADGKDYQVSFEDFVSATSKTALDTRDIKSIVFSFASTTGTQKEVNFFVDNVSFSKEKVISNKSLQVKTLKMYPNPTKGAFQVSFASDAERQLVLTVTDVAGRTILRQTVQASRGSNAVTVQLPAARSAGIVTVSLKNDDTSYESANILSME